MPEGLATDFAVKFSLSCVDTHVIVQVRGLYVLFATYLAFVRLVSIMRILMAFKVAWVFIFLATYLAREQPFFCVHFCMSIENSHRRETFVALWARKFFGSVYCFDVAL